MSFEKIIADTFTPAEQERVEREAYQEILHQLHTTLIDISESFPVERRPRICARSHQDELEEMTLATTYSFRTKSLETKDEATGEMYSAVTTLHFKEWSSGIVVDMYEVIFEDDEPDITPLAQLSIDSDVVMVTDFSVDGPPKRADMYEIGEYNRVLEQAFSQRDND